MSNFGRLWPAVSIVAMALGVLVLSWRGDGSQQDFVSTEGLDLYEPDAFDEPALSMLHKSQAAAKRGQLKVALEWMERAVAYQRARAGTSNFELWDNLAELYCANAGAEKDAPHAETFRVKGLAMLRQFQCGVDLWGDSIQCQDISDRKGICFQTHCVEEADGHAAGKWDAFMDAEPVPGSFTWQHEDRKNLASIAKLCHADKTKKN